MKEFMLIFIGEDYSTLGLSPQELQQRMDKWMAWSAKMATAGVMKSGEALHPHSRHIAGPKRTVTDRAAGEVKEIVGGYYVVTATDMDAAAEIAQDFPDYDLGSAVEIREVVDFSQQPG